MHLKVWRGLRVGGRAPDELLLHQLVLQREREKGRRTERERERKRETGRDREMEREERQGERDRERETERKIERARGEGGGGERGGGDEKRVEKGRKRGVVTDLVVVQVVAGCEGSAVERIWHI